MMRAQQYYHQSHTGYDAQNLENSPPPNQWYNSANFQNCQSSSYNGNTWETSPPSNHLECHFTQRDSCTPESSGASSNDYHLINRLNKKQRIAAARDRYRRIPRDEPNERNHRHHRHRENPSELSKEDQSKTEHEMAKEKRNEKARQKYQSMSAEERKKINKMRESYRKKRKSTSKKIYMDHNQGMSFF